MTTEFGRTSSLSVTHTEQSGQVPLADRLTALIPSRLKEICRDPSRVGVIKTEEWIGSWDRGFEAEVEILIVEKGFFEIPVLEQEDPNSVWGEFVNTKRLGAIHDGVLNGADRLLIAFIADGRWNPSSLYVMSYADAAGIRRQGVGRAFFENLGAVALASGYRYMYGVASKENLGFFAKMGWHGLAEIRLNATEMSLLFSPAVRRRTTSVVKFLDRELEEHCIQPSSFESGESANSNTS